MFCRGPVAHYHYRCDTNNTIFTDACTADDDVLHADEILDVLGVRKSAGVCVAFLCGATLFFHLLAYRCLRRKFH